MKKNQGSKKFVLFKLDRESKLLRKLDSVKIQNERKEVQDIFENNLELILPNCFLVKTEFIFPYKVAEKDKRVDTVVFFDNKKNVKTFLLIEYKREKTDKITVQTSAYIKNLVGGEDIISIQNRFSLLTLLNNKLLENKSNRRPKLLNLNDINWEKIKGVCVAPEYYDYQIVGHRGHGNQENNEKIILVKMTIYEENIFCIESQDLPEWLKIGFKPPVSKIKGDGDEGEEQTEEGSQEVNKSVISKGYSPTELSQIFNKLEANEEVEEWTQQIVKWIEEKYPILIRKIVHEGVSKSYNVTNYYFKNEIIISLTCRKKYISVFIKPINENLLIDYELERNKIGPGSKKCDCLYKIGDDDSFQRIFGLLEIYLKNWKGISN